MNEETPRYLTTNCLSHVEHVPLDDKTRSQFQYALASEQKDRLLAILRRFVSFASVEYFLAYGTLLGAILYEGVIPWDDDLDLLCFYKDYEQVKADVLAQPDLDWHEIRSDETGELIFSKICWKVGSANYREPAAGWGSAWTWPFLDIMWLVPRNDGNGAEKDASYIDPTNLIRYRASEFLPARLRTFEGFQYPCPNQDVAVILKAHPFSLQSAIPAYWDHVNEQQIELSKLRCVRLEELSELYPVLQRTLPEAQAQAAIFIK